VNTAIAVRGHEIPTDKFPWGRKIRKKRSGILHSTATDGEEGLTCSTRKTRMARARRFVNMIRLRKGIVYLARAPLTGENPTRRRSLGAHRRSTCHYRPVCPVLQRGRRPQRPKCFAVTVSCRLS